MTKNVVTILAEQVIKPLIISFEKEENVKANESPAKEISPIGVSVRRSSGRRSGGRLLAMT